MIDREMRLDRVIGLVLLVGSTVSLTLMAMGAIILLVVGHGSSLYPGPSVGEAVQASAHLDPYGLMDLGILILMATPVIRVIALVPGFLWEGRGRFALVALLVLAFLMVSFTLAANASL